MQPTAHGPVAVVSHDHGAGGHWRSSDHGAGQGQCIRAVCSKDLGSLVIRLAIAILLPLIFRLIAPIIAGVDPMVLPPGVQTCLANLNGRERLAPLLAMVETDILHAS